MIPWAFLIIALFGIFFAFFLKVYLSGVNLNRAKLFFCLIFNGCFIVPYINIIEGNALPFVSNGLEVGTAHPFIGWVAFFCIFIHSSALPVKRKIKPWFMRS
ncbi:hypothetical protein GIW69_12215 [Pseudomonas syringae]|nr:hypothetical protein [Pseudomonas syringae]